MPDENIVKTTADAIKGIADAVPVYPDALQPAARELGRGLETIAKTVNVALAPLSGLVWGYEMIANYLKRRITELLAEESPEAVATPAARVAGPILEGMRFVAGDDEL